MGSATYVHAPISYAPVPSCETSSKLLEYVRANPGLPVGQLVRRLGISCGTVYYHLGRLTQQDLLRTVPAGRWRLVFPGEAIGETSDVEALSVLRSRTRRAVAVSIASRPQSSIMDVIHATGESARAVYYHVKILRAAGLVASASPARYRHLSATPRLPRLLAMLEAEGSRR